MAKITWGNLYLNKLNKSLKQLKRTGVLVGPRASKGSYGDLANILQASVDKEKRPGLTKGRSRRPSPFKKFKKRREMSPAPQPLKKRGMGIAVKGGGRIL
jgi:hypothetical protein